MPGEFSSEIKAKKRVEGLSAYEGVNAFGGRIRNQLVRKGAPR